LGDRERLRTAVRSLLDNAAKFSPPGSLVEVRLHDGELTVRDHGPGIPPADLPYVFDRFYRAAAARGVPGSGLGLSIVRQVAEGYGGTVRAEVPADGGTLVRLQMTRALPGADPGGTHAVIAQDRRHMVGGRLSRTARGITARTCGGVSRSSRPRAGPPGARGTRLRRSRRLRNAGR
jgi:anti-sigma regulatory factor (Ser/Thr protein kinase)